MSVVYFGTKLNNKSQQIIQIGHDYSMHSLMSNFSVFIVAHIR